MLKSDPTLFDAVSFARLLCLERKRIDRSGRAFLLVLLELPPSRSQGSWPPHRLVPRVVRALRACLRQTDLLGWYQPQTAIGVICTEVRHAALAQKTITAKVTAALQARLTPDQLDAMTLSVYLYPQQDKALRDAADNGKVYLDLQQQTGPRRLKRLLDLLGSFSLLLLLSPLLLLIAVAIKGTSKGPIVYKQERLGQFGQPFTFVKFRSMYDNADPCVHQHYIQAFIQQSGNGAAASEPLKQDGLYKLSRDARVTPLGQFLRRQSLDELPQLLHVLQGTMSLVGPRPPLAYEVEQYRTWHRRRVLEAKPGLTGLWQVTGRSRTSFDDMVRLDLRYIDTWSLWADLKILLQTPWAVITGAGAR